MQATFGSELAVSAAAKDQPPVCVSLVQDLQPCGVPVQEGKEPQPCDSGQMRRIAEMIDLISVPCSKRKPSVAC